MPTNGSNPLLVLFSLITACLIVICFIVMSDSPSYTLSVADFTATLPKASTEYHIEGTLSASAPLSLCDETACIPVQLTPRTRQPHLATPGKHVVIFGHWIDNALEATEVITPCHTTP